MDTVQAIGALTPTDYEAITVSNASIGLTSTLIEKTSTLALHELGKARLVFMTVETNSIRYRIDGGAPAGAGGAGHLVTAGSTITVSGYQALRNLRMIRDSADASVRVTYFR